MIPYCPNPPKPQSGAIPSRAFFGGSGAVSMVHRNRRSTTRQVMSGFWNPLDRGNSKFKFLKYWKTYWKADSSTLQFWQPSSLYKCLWKRFWNLGTLCRCNLASGSYSPKCTAGKVRAVHLTGASCALPMASVDTRHEEQFIRSSMPNAIFVTRWVLGPRKKNWRQQRRCRAHAQWKVYMRLVFECVVAISQALVTAMEPNTSKL